MIKSNELMLDSGTDESVCNNVFENNMELNRNKEIYRSSSIRFESYNEKNNEENNGKNMQKFTLIFNKYNDKLNMKPLIKNQEDKSNDKMGSKYTMIFNKDVTIRSKMDFGQSKNAEENVKVKANKVNSKPEIPLIEPELSTLKLNDAEILMNLYGRSNLFIPELTICSLLPENCEKSVNKDTTKTSDLNLKTHNSWTSLSKSKTIRRVDHQIKNKIASLTSLETHPNKDIPRRHIPNAHEKKLFRVRSLDLTESVSTGTEIECQPLSNNPNESFKADDTPRKSDKKSRGDAMRKGEKDNGYRKQVQWKSEVDVIYFESHQTAEGDRAGEILGRVIEPLREEWEQQRTGFYAKMVPLPIGSHLNERWQSLLKI